MEKSFEGDNSITNMSQNINISENMSEQKVNNYDQGGYKSNNKKIETKHNYSYDQCNYISSYRYEYEKTY